MHCRNILKYLLIMFLFTIILSPVVSDDTYFFMAGGSLHPTAEGVTVIEMAAESVKIELFREHYTVNVDFNFVNRGNSEYVIVGFPVKTQGMHGDGLISEFQSWTNDNPDESQLKVLEKYWQLETGIISAWTRFVQFPANEVTRSGVRFDSTYGRSSPSDQLCTYLYGTGSVWAGPIGSIEVSVVNRTASWIYDIQLGRSGAFPAEIRWISDNELRFKLHDIEPEYTDTLRIHLGPELLERGPRILPASYWLDERTLSPIGLSLLSSTHLRLLRNLVYAIHGYSFRSPDLDDYYRSHSWYSPSGSFSESQLNEVERANIQMILAEESKRNNR